MGGLQISWSELMELPIPDRAAFVEVIETQRKQEQDLLKAIHGLKPK